jgi:hypothetical protein
MRTKQRSSQCRVPRASLLLTLTTIILFSCSQQSLAQQRDGDATNADSNSSSASNGRVNFNIIQLMNGEYLEMFSAGTSRGIPRGHPTNSRIELGSQSADPLMFSTNPTEVSSLVAVKAKSPSYALSLPAAGSITANPSPIQVCDGSGLGVTTLSWTSTGTSVVEVHLDEPSGMLVGTGGPSSTVTTGKWVGNSTQFFLQDASGGLPLSPENTLASVTVYLAGCSSPGDHWSNNSNHINNTNTGNVGIGTSGPVFKLDVRGGQINSAEGLCINGDCKSAWSQVGGAWTTAGSNIAFTMGNVGIGTTTPNRILELAHDVGGISLEAGTGSPNSGVIRFGDNSGWKFHFGRSRDSVGGALNSGTSGVLMTIQDNGNVGIGTPNPSRKLHLATNSIQSIDGILLQSLDGHFSLTAPSLGQGNYNGITQAGDIGIIYGNGITSGTGAFVIAPWAVATSGLRMDSNGNVGIGTPVTNFKLDVNGEINATGFRINGIPISTGPSAAVSSVFGRTGAVVQQAGDYTWAQINKSTSSLADIATRSAGDLSSGTLPDARFPTTLPAVSGANLTALNASNLANGTVPIARLGSGTADSTKFLRGDNTWAVPSGTSQWTTSGTSIFYNSGNVGVGTPGPPTEKLEVIGNIKVSGNINAKYQDVAEWVDSSQELVAGTVVVLDSSRSNHVIAATQSYDSRIAGVISLQPGLTLGEEAEGRVLVATTGRVRVKVDATEGAIQIGDLLVTSNREGFAMKSLPIDVGGVRMHRPGTLIGKALEPLAKGTGEILVLLSLQ